jgi:hypothetical protein
MYEFGLHYNLTKFIKGVAYKHLWHHFDNYHYDLCKIDNSRSFHMWINVTILINNDLVYYWLMMIS